MGIVKWCHPGDLVSASIWKILQKKISHFRLWTIGAFPITLPSIGGEWCLLLCQPTFWDDLFWFLYKSVKYVLCCPISNRVETFTPSVLRTSQPETFSQLEDIRLGSFCHDLWEQGALYTRSQG
jgi:hypothetical protein